MKATIQANSSTATKKKIQEPETLVILENSTRLYHCHNEIEKGKVQKNLI